MPRLAGTVADSLLALQRACLPSTAWLPRFLQAKRLIDTSAGHTLDASCGNGDFTVWMAQQGMRITGVDFSAHELELAQARARDTGVSINFEVCDLANAHGLPDAGFDQAREKVSHRRKVTFAPLERDLSRSGRGQDGRLLLANIFRPAELTIQEINRTPAKRL